MVFRTFGLPPTYCGEVGTVYLASDLTRDCQVNLDDFAFLSTRWSDVCDPNMYCEGADLNKNDVVDLPDLNILTSSWLDCTDPETPCNYYADRW